jgi:uncharacterized protein
MSLTDAELIARLGLSPHVEGGFFRQTYRSGWTVALPGPDGGERLGLTAIFYLLTRQSSICHFHRNRSDMLHCFHLGSPLTYIVVHPDGRLERLVLGADLDRGQHLQLAIPGGVWKATHLPDGSFGLASEILAPGYDDRDCEMASPVQMQGLFPHLWPTIAPFVAGAERVQP